LEGQFPDFLCVGKGQEGQQPGSGPSFPRSARPLEQPLDQPALIDLNPVIPEGTTRPYRQPASSTPPAIQVDGSPLLEWMMTGQTTGWTSRTLTTSRDGLDLTIANPSPSSALANLFLSFVHL
jgi:hypothetical protein